MPQRFLRPGIRNSARWNSVSFESQSTFIRVLTLVDDYGRCDGRASVVLGECFSVWNEQHPGHEMTSAGIRSALQELADAELVDIYDVPADGKRVLQILQWEERIRDGAKEKWPKNDNPQQSAATRISMRRNSARRNCCATIAISFCPKSDWKAKRS